MQHALARNIESEFLTRLRIAGNFGNRVRNVGRLLIFIHSRLRRSECDTSRHHRDKMLQRINDPRINGGFAGIRQMVSDLKFSFAGTQRKVESVSALFRLWSRRHPDRLASCGLRLGIVNIGIFRRIELETRVIHLRARRAGRIVHSKNPRNPKLALRRLQIHEVRDRLYAVNLLTHVIDLHGK